MLQITNIMILLVFWLKKNNFLIFPSHMKELLLSKAYDLTYITYSNLKLLSYLLIRE